MTTTSPADAAEAVEMVSANPALSVLEQPGQLAAADHARLIDHQHRAGVQLLLSSIQVA